MRHIEDQLQKSIVRWFDLQYANLRHLLIHVPKSNDECIISSVELDTYQTESGESYAVLRVNDLADDNAMLEFAVIGKEFDVLKLAFLGRMKG